MSTFEFVFSLFGLLLGFALVEVLSGLVRATQSWDKSEGHFFLTPALGLVVALDLITFWMVLFRAREALPVNTLTLYLGFVVSAVYYWAASMIFPGATEKSADLDSHYFAVRRRVIAAVLFCNYATYSALSVAVGQLPQMVDMAELGIFTILLTAVMIARSKRASALTLTTVVAAYIASAIWHASAMAG